MPWSMAPKFISRMLTRPVWGLKRFSATLAMMTQLRKWGRYSTVWETFLYRGKRSSFSSSARMMGTGNPTSRSRKLKAREFFRARRKSLSLKIFSKICSPTYSLPEYPLAGL